MNERLGKRKKHQSYEQKKTDIKHVNHVVVECMERKEVVILEKQWEKERQGGKRCCERIM